MSGNAYHAIYDFALMPYALGDVLTWNVHSAIRCEELGRKQVDAHICVDERTPSNIHQPEFVTAANSGLLFNELFGAFGTQPYPGNLFFHRSRESLLTSLRDVAQHDDAARESAQDYERTLGEQDAEARNAYFSKHAYSHEAINAFYRKANRIPLLASSPGCEPDVAGLLERRFAGKKVVVIHMRLRRLDIGYGGANSYARDSDFAEWLGFLREAERRHPEVQFVALGRRQEKPLEMLALSNVACLRGWGLGLGHELTLVRHCDLFIGASSGFAAMAYFSQTPYFITRMTQSACKAYDIEFGAKQFPFGNERQHLIYEPETSELLMKLLERGLADSPPRGGGAGGPRLDPAIDVRSWEWERAQWLYPGATSYRFFDDASFADKETAFLLWPKVRAARAAPPAEAWSLLEQIGASFPRVSERFPEYLRLRRDVALQLDRVQIADQCEKQLNVLAAADSTATVISRYVRRLYPVVEWLKWAWSRKHRIPRRLARLLRNRFAAS